MRRLLLSMKCMVSWRLRVGMRVAQGDAETPRVLGVVEPGCCLPLPYGWRTCGAQPTRGSCMKLGSMSRPDRSVRSPPCAAQV